MESPEALGYALIGYAKELCVPQRWRWNTYFPKPRPDTAADAAKSGDAFFFRSLEWILRHELGHIALNHHDSGAVRSRAAPKNGKQTFTLPAR